MSSVCIDDASEFSNWGLGVSSSLSVWFLSLCLSLLCLSFFFCAKHNLTNQYIVAMATFGQNSSYFILSWGEFKSPQFVELT